MMQVDACMDFAKSQDRTMLENTKCTRADALMLGQLLTAACLEIGSVRIKHIG